MSAVDSLCGRLLIFTVVLVTDAIPRPSSHSDWGEMDAPARVLNHFSTSWSIAAYTEVGGPKRLW